MSAARRCFPENRIIVAFQPHRYTRTRDQLEGFAQSFGAASELLLLDIYSAGESPIEGISSDVLAAKIAETGFGAVRHVGTKDQALAVLLQELRAGDVVFTLGAGDVYKLGERILHEMPVA
jgi:UDP-N-acetylmuramate--alanine ligase